MDPGERIRKGPGVVRELEVEEGPPGGVVRALREVEEVARLGPDALQERGRLGGGDVRDLRPRLRQLGVLGLLDVTDVPAVVPARAGVREELDALARRRAGHERLAL